MKPNVNKNDIGSITADMDLGLASPMEYNNINEDKVEGVTEEYWSTRDIIELYKAPVNTVERYDHWALEASNWGSALARNYHDGPMTYPPVKYVNCKFYVYVKGEWVEVPFNYDVLTREYIEGGRMLDESKKHKRVKLTESQVKYIIKKTRK